MTSQAFVDDQPKGRRLAAVPPPGRRSRSFVALFALVVVLNLTGLAMVLSASSADALVAGGSPWGQFLRQAGWFAVSLVGLVVVLRIDYRRWRAWGPRMVGLAVLLLALVLVPGVGVEVNGATRWLGWGPLSVQPSEFAKLALVVFVADLLARRARWIDDLRLTLLPVLVVFVAIAGLIMFQPNLGTTLVLFAVVMVMLFVAGVPGVPLLGVLGAGAAAGAVFAVAFPWRWRRITAFLDPWADPQGAGFQPLEARAAAATGGPFGTQPGEGRAKWGYLPEAQNDFIFAVVAEETGLVGGLLVIGAFVALGVVGFHVASRAPDRFGMLLATGITTWFLAQALLNIGQTVGVLPVMGVPLPFLSSGGSSLLFSMLAVGMLLNVARHAR